MASTALEEKINKIRLRNEEIKRRYEEVEADKKNAAKLDALLEPIPAEDWPERKEPPEFSAPLPKHTNKPKHLVRKLNDQPPQYYTGSSGDVKKAHNFGDGQGPPPDPKYNFLADSEREEHGEEAPKDTERNRGRSKPTRGIFKRRGSGRDWHAKEQWTQQGCPGDATRPDYEAWRAERNRIDEARISRQRTAEGNWRREWDNDKVHLADEASKRENRVSLGDVVTRQEHQNDSEKLYRSPRIASRNSQYTNARDSYHGSAFSEANKGHGSVNEPEKRVVITTDRSIKVMLNPSSTPPKSSVMSVKVSPPNIVGTGRVGPRQRPRVVYSSQSDADASIHETPQTFTRQKSTDEKIKIRSFEQTLKTSPPKSPHPQRKRDIDPKSPYAQRRDSDKIEQVEATSKVSKKDSVKSPYTQRRGNSSGNYPPKSPRVHRESTEGVKNDSTKSPRAQQERIKDKSKTTLQEGQEHHKSNEILNNFDNINRENESIPIELPRELINLPAEASESDENYTPANGTINYSQPSEQYLVESDVFFESAENNLSNEEIKLNSAILQSNDNIILDTVTNNNSERDDSVKESFEESVPEITADTTESGLNSADNDVVENTEENCNAFSEQPSLQLSMSPLDEVPSAINNVRVIELNDIHGEASGSQESNNKLSDNIDMGSTSSQALVNCSVDSGLTCNDSGFLELPSNDSIQDVSNNGYVETSDFAETSVDSIESENEILEYNHNIVNLDVEPNVSNPMAQNIDDPSSSHLENTPASINVSDEAQKISNAAEIDNEAENMRNTVDDVTDMKQFKDTCVKSSDVQEDTASNSKVTENCNVNIESIELDMQEKDIVHSLVQKEVVNNLNTLKFEESDDGITDEAAKVAKSATISESSNNICQQIVGVIAENINISINESESVSKNPNDINNENTVDPATAETPSLLDTKKVEAVDEQIN